MSCHLCEGFGSIVWRDGVASSAFDKAQSEAEPCPACKSARSRAPDKYKSLEGAENEGCISNETLKAAVRELFVRLPMIRAMDEDYENGVALLRRVFNLGRSRGMFEGDH